MATITYRVCDRCHSEINEHSRKLSKVPKYRPTKILWIVTGYVIESNRELCASCTEDLEEFFKRGMTEAIT